MQSAPPAKKQKPPNPVATESDTLNRQISAAMLLQCNWESEYGCELHSGKSKGECPLIKDGGTCPNDNYKGYTAPFLLTRGQVKPLCEGCVDEDECGDKLCPWFLQGTNTTDHSHEKHVSACFRHISECKYSPEGGNCFHCRSYITTVMKGTKILMKSNNIKEIPPSDEQKEPRRSTTERVTTLEEALATSTNNVSQKVNTPLYDLFKDRTHTPPNETETNEDDIAEHRCIACELFCSGWSDAPPCFMEEECRIRSTNCFERINLKPLLVERFSPFTARRASISDGRPPEVNPFPNI